MSLSVDIGWNWCAFGLTAGYRKDKIIRTKAFVIQIGFIIVAFEWGY